MKRKLFALAAAAVFGVMSVGALAACDGKKSAPPPHVCEHVCPEPDCGKCLDADCADPVCADKCEGHEFLPIPTGLQQEKKAWQQCFGGRVY